MSRPTLQERAAAYVAGCTPYAPGGSLEGEVVAHLAQFAAQEVARVREMQKAPLVAILSVIGRYVCANRTAHCPCDAHRAYLGVYSATRPERPARAKAVYLCSKPLNGLPDCNNVLDHKGRCGWTALREPNGGVVTDVNHKPVKRPAWCSCGKCGPCPDIGKEHCFHNAEHPTRFHTKKCRDAYEATKRPGLSALATAAKKGKR